MKCASLWFFTSRTASGGRRSTRSSSSASPRAGHVRALVLTPTRELAAQIGERTAAYGKHLNLTP